MSASRSPTDRPRAAIEAARLTVTLDLPTPPLPEATAYTRVSDPGCANGISGPRHRPADKVGDLRLLRAGGGGQVDLDMHAVVGFDCHRFHHAQLCDRPTQLRVDHLGQR